MKNYSMNMTSAIHDALVKHLIRPDGQEDLCFATYIPSTGAMRTTGIITEIILPNEGDRNVHWNVGFMPEYFERAIRIARGKKQGLVFLHSHLTPGWQGMSQDDVVAETRLAPAAFATTSLPLVGLTMGTDGACSARFWIKDPYAKRSYQRFWCENVRVIGKKLSITFNDYLLKPAFNSEQQLRTISAWGPKIQGDLSRIKIVIAGLGSVGSIIAEILARAGFSNFILIDFDLVELKNLDRCSGMFKEDVGRYKVDTVRDAILKCATSQNVNVRVEPFSICEKEGFQAALDGDVVFSCVDRPWPRQVLNFISYAHLVPVIDGGILVRTNSSNTRIIGADWKAQTVGYKRACLECLGQYKTENAILERNGFLDDPSYVLGLIEDKAYKEAHENVFPFSSNLASLEVLQLLSLFIAPSGLADMGQQMFHFTLGTMDQDKTKGCCPECYFQSIVGEGDSCGVQVYDRHLVAENARAIQQSITK